MFAISGNRFVKCSSPRKSRRFQGTDHDALKHKVVEEVSKCKVTLDPRLARAVGIVAPTSSAASSSAGDSAKTH
jgi:hypothetical protein